MTESEAIEGLGILNNGLNETFVNADELSEALQMAIQALEEVQKYREVGTVEECRFARDKQIQKKPIDRCMYKECPACGNVEIGFCKHCPDCGQRLDGSDEDEID